MSPGAANEPRTGWQVQGLIALAALYLWGWSARTRRAEDGRAAGWLLAGAIVSLLLAGALAGGMPLIDVRAWQPFGEPGATTAFDWNQTYGPLPWSTSTATMAEAVSRSPHLWRATELDRFDGSRFFASGDAPAEPARARHRTPQPALDHLDHLHRPCSRGPRPAEPRADPHGTGAPGPSPPRLGSPAPDGTLAAPSTLAGGARYTITAYAPQPSVEGNARRRRGALAAGFRPYVRFDVPTTEGPAGGGLNGDRRRAGPDRGLPLRGRLCPRPPPALRCEEQLRPGHAHPGVPATAASPTTPTPP